MGRATSGAEVGAGVRYDFGRVHLEALDNALGVANQDQRVHQALVGVGSTFPWHGETEFCLSEFAEMQLAPAHFPGNVRT